MGTQASSFPWTLSAGDPYAVPSSTPGKASPIFRTVSKPIALLGIGQRDSLMCAAIIPESWNPFKIPVVEAPEL